VHNVDELESDFRFNLYNDYFGYLRGSGSDSGCAAI
jgi:hypothetical protein